VSTSIKTELVRKVLERERTRLRKCRAHDFETNRARSSAATEDALSRVLVLEELLDPGAVALTEEEKAAGT
jgi:hypothetical protein